jgi:hypothetical protein
MQKTKAEIFHFLVANVHNNVFFLLTQNSFQMFQQNKPNLTTAAASENDTK